MSMRVRGGLLTFMIWWGVRWGEVQHRLWDVLEFWGVAFRDSCEGAFAFAFLPYSDSLTFVLAFILSGILAFHLEYILTSHLFWHRFLTFCLTFWHILRSIIIAHTSDLSVCSILFSVQYIFYYFLTTLLKVILTLLAAWAPHRV